MSAARAAEQEVLMRQTYRIVAGIVALLVVVQAAVIALSVFGMFKFIDGGGAFDKSALESEDVVYNEQVGEMIHGGVGLILIPLLSLVLLIISFVAEVDRGVRLAAVLLGLVALQVVLAFASFDAPVVGALHGVNAFAILGIAVLAYVRAGRPAAAGSSAPTTKSSVPA
jgi:hypothetical protein